MGDWARTHLSIYADKETLMRAINQLGYKDPHAKNHLETDEVLFSLWNIIRPPTDYLGEYYAPSRAIMGDEHDNRYNWYLWNIENWGTKWDCGNPKRKEDLDNGEVTYEFDTVWDFPIKALDELAYQYPEATMVATVKYSDGNATIATWKNGEQIGITEF